MPDDDEGDEEQGGDNGKGSGDGDDNNNGGKKKQGQKRQQATPNRGMLKGPGTPDQSPQQNGHYGNQNQQQYVEPEGPYVQPTYNDYESGYVSHYTEPLTRNPSIDIDWQRPRPARAGRR